MGTELLLREQDLPSLEEGSFIIISCLDCLVEDETGTQIGTIIEITQGVVDVFTIRRLGTQRCCVCPVYQTACLDDDNGEDGHSKLRCVG